jgi:hypothetical protein
MVTTLIPMGDWCGSTQNRYPIKNENEGAENPGKDRARAGVEIDPAEKMKIFAMERCFFLTGPFNG